VSSERYLSLVAKWTSDEIDVADDVAAVLVTNPSIDWAKELSAVPSMMERLTRRSAMMRLQEQDLLKQLAGLPVQVEGMDALGGFTVRGRRSDVARLRSALTGSAFEVVPEATFHTLRGTAT
jgi:hypothetical protein